MLITITIILLLILSGMFLTLRIPVLKLDPHTSEEEKLQTLNAWLQVIHDAGKFNGSVLLYRKGGVLFSGSYGTDSAEGAQALSEHSSYNLASVSKQFTAMGVVILKERGMLEYTDSLADHIPELSSYRNITIEHLLHHTSGLPDYMQQVSKHRKADELVTTAGMITVYQENEPALLFEPGEKFQYSNIGYVLLAEIIARVSGEPFSLFMSKNIFGPLGMKDTQVFNLLSDAVPANRVYGFKRRFWWLGGSRIPHDLSHFDGVAGDGGIYSSAHDLVLWHEALTGGRLVSMTGYERAYESGRLNDGTATGYGYGWFINEDGTVEHAGGWRGFSSYVHRNRQEGELIVILDNSANVLRVTSNGYRLNSIALNLRDLMASLIEHHLVDG